MPGRRCLGLIETLRAQALHQGDLCPQAQQSTPADLADLLADCSICSLLDPRRDGADGVAALPAVLVDLARAPLLALIN